jgi:hypothetical protein
MADILTITGPNGFLTRLGDAYAEGYAPQIEDGNGNLIPNPQTRVQYARARLVDAIAGRIQYFEQRALQNQAETVPKIALTFSQQVGV